MARLAAKYDVLVISDEVHAPLTHPGVAFAPFLAVAREFPTRTICVTSASKGWNLAGLKCAILVGGDERALAILDRFPGEVTSRTSILGLHANVAAFAATEWLDATIGRIVANDRMLDRLLRDSLPRALYYRPAASYLGWIDLGAYHLGADPASTLIQSARVALNSGQMYGRDYADFVRINLACEPEVLTEAVRRLGDAIASRNGSDAPAATERGR